MPHISITAYNKTDADHLAEVVEQMKTLGAPTIRAVETCNGLVAIEGSHRLAAASALGLTPRFVVIDADETLTSEDLGDIAHNVWCACEVDGDGPNSFTVTVEELAGFLATPDGKFYNFED